MMDVAELREWFHKYIEVADERQLNAVYLLLEDKMQAENHTDIYEEAIMNMLYAMREAHRSGTSISYSVEEVIKMATQRPA